MPNLLPIKQFRQWKDLAYVIMVVYRNHSQENLHHEQSSSRLAWPLRISWNHHLLLRLTWELTSEGTSGWFCLIVGVSVQGWRKNHENLSSGRDMTPSYSSAVALGSSYRVYYLPSSSGFDWDPDREATITPSSTQNCPFVYEQFLLLQSSLSHCKISMILKFSPISPSFVSPQGFYLATSRVETLSGTVLISPSLPALWVRTRGTKLNSLPFSHYRVVYSRTISFSIPE